MPEKESATGGQPMAGGLSELGRDAQPQYTTENGDLSGDFATDSDEQGASIPFMITAQQRMQLAGLGFTEQQIKAMKPSEAHGILGEYSHPKPSGNGNGTGDEDDLLNEIERLADQSMVEPPDQITPRRVQALIEQMAGYQGHARQVSLDALRVLIGRLSAEDRGRLNLYPLFDPPKQQEQIEHYLASCPVPGGAPVFTPKSLGDLLAMPPKQWLIEQVLGAGDVCMVYGPPGSGKSFVVIDLIFAACLGQQWAMRFDVARPLAVAYCAGEGASGLPQRFAAAADRYGVQALPGFTFFDAAPQLYVPERSSAEVETIERFVQEWQDRRAAGEAGNLDVLIVDTLHSATAGADENSAQDMGQVLRAVKAASKALGCAVILVHHSNKAGTGERGSSAMRGAMDCMIEIKPTAGKFALSCEKLKDGAAWKPQTFDLIEVGESARVWWDEPSDLPSNTGKQSANLLATMQQHPGQQFTAKQLAEVAGAGQSATINVLTRLVDKGQVTRSLQYEDKPSSNRNPWVYKAVISVDRSS